jgi:hypothetical protein
MMQVMYRRPRNIRRRCTKFRRKDEMMPGFCTIAKQQVEITVQ